MIEDIENLPGVGSSTAESLREQGYDSLQDIAKLSPRRLAVKTSLSESKAEEAIQAARVHAEIGGFDTGSNILKEPDDIRHLSTGVQALNALLDGGVKTKLITGIYGSKGSGRIAFIHQLAVRAQLPLSAGGLGGAVAFIKVGDHFYPERILDIVESVLTDEERDALAEQYGVAPDPDELGDAVLDNILVWDTFNSNHQILQPERIRATIGDRDDSDPPISLIIEESLMAHFVVEYSDRAELGERQMKLNKHLNDLERLANTYNVPVVAMTSVSSSGTPYSSSVLDLKFRYALKSKNTSGEKLYFELVSAPSLPLRKAGLYPQDGGLVDAEDP